MKSLPTYTVRKGTHGFTPKYKTCLFLSYKTHDSTQNLSFPVCLRAETLLRKTQESENNVDFLKNNRINALPII